MSPLSSEAAQNKNLTWTKNPLKMEVGNVNSKHILLALKAKSVLDPCEDENEDIEDDNVSLGEDSAQEDYSDFSGSEKQHSHEDQFIVMPNGKNRSLEDKGAASEDGMQDPEQDELNLAAVREWIASGHTDSVDLADVLSNFPSIPMVLIEEKLIKEELLTEVGKDNHVINRTKKPHFEMPDVKEEMDLAVTIQGEKTSKNGEGNHMYMKASYHALPLEYVTVTKLQRELKGNTSLYCVRKLIDKMTLEGILKVESNGKLGKLVIQSEAAEKKLEEVKRAIEMGAKKTMNPSAGASILLVQI